MVVLDSYWFLSTDKSLAHYFLTVSDILDASIRPIFQKEEGDAYEKYVRWYGSSQKTVVMVILPRINLKRKHHHGMEKSNCISKCGCVINEKKKGEGEL